MSSVVVQAADSVNVNPLMHTAAGAMNVIGGTAMQFAKQQQMMAQQMQMMAQMNALAPKIVPAKYFGCPVGPAMADMPSGGFCPKDSQDPSLVNSIPTFRNIKSMAEQNANFFEKLLNEAQNTKNAVGIQCLQDSLKRSMDEMQMQINSLQDLADKIAKENQTFREQNKAIIDQMKDVNSELNGGMKTGDQKARRFAENFSAGCVQYMGESSLETYKGQNKGLLALRNDQASLNDQANNLMSKRPQIEKDLITQINEFKKAVALNGIDGVLRKGAFIPKSGITSFQGAFKNLSETKGAQINLRIETIKGKLQSELGYTVPDLDGNFNGSIESLVQNADEFFTKKKVNECARTSLGLSNSELLASLRHTSSTNSDILERYKRAIANILGNSDIQADVAAKQIQDLDKQYGGKIVLQLTGTSGQDTSATPYAYMQNIIAGCKDGLNYNKLNDGQSTASGGSALKQLGSERDLIEAGKKYLQEIASISKNAASELANEFYEQVANCSGAKTEVSECKNGDNFSADQPGFCIKKAVNCSQQINSCYREIDVAIKTRQTKMNTLAATYDKNVAGLVANQERFLGQVKSRVDFYQKMMARTYPGTVVELPGVSSGKDKENGLFVSMPEKILNEELGVYLRGGGKIDEFEKLPEKIVKLKDMVTKQKDAVKKEVEEYIVLQRQATEKNKEKWMKVAEQCEGSEKNAVAAAQKAEAAAQKAAQAAQKKQNEFCSKFASMKSKVASGNPAAICGEPVEGLMKSLGEATESLVSRDAATISRSVNQYCSSVQASSKDSTESDEGSKKSGSDLASLCDENGGNSSSVLGSLFDLAEKSVPAGNSTEFQAVKDLLNEGKISEAKIKLGEIKAEGDDKDKIKSSKSLYGNIIAAMERGTPADTAAPAGAETQFNKYIKTPQRFGICYPKAVDTLIGQLGCQDKSGTLDGCKASLPDESAFNEAIRKNLSSSPSINRLIASEDADEAKEKYNSLGLGQMADISCVAKDDSKRGLGEMSVNDLARSINNSDIMGIQK